ncbi:MAG: type IX secretion system membrane protein PorP/SprF [Marinifilaceae bacterium]
MRKYIYLFLIVVIANVFQGKAQDIRFSQFYANKLYLNPALAGSDNYSHFSLNYRNQWPNLDLPFVSYSFSYDKFFKPLNGGLGFLVVQDDQGNGALKTTTISGMYSYYLRITEEFVIRTALQLSFMQRKLEWDKLVFPDQISPIYGNVYPHNTISDPINRSRGGIDFTTGLVGSYRNFYLGFAVNHLSQPNFNFSDELEQNLEMRYSIHMGIEIPMAGRSDFNLAPALLFQKQGDFTQMNYGLYINKSALVAGAWLSQNFDLEYDSVILMVGLDNKIFRLAYSFDYAITKLIQTNTGAHEISLSFLIGNKSKSRIRAVRCPKF